MINQATGAARSSESSRSMTPAMPGQEGAHVLDPQISFDHRFDQVTAGPRGHQAHAENDAHPERDQKNEKGHADAGSCAEDQ